MLKKNVAVAFRRQAVSVKLLITARVSSGLSNFPGERLTGSKMQH